MPIRLLDSYILNLLKFGVSSVVVRPPLQHRIIYLSLAKPLKTASHDISFQMLGLVLLLAFKVLGRSNFLICLPKTVHVEQGIVVYSRGWIRPVSFNNHDFKIISPFMNASLVAAIA